MKDRSQHCISKDDTGDWSRTAHSETIEVSDIVKVKSIDGAGGTLTGLYAFRSAQVDEFRNEC